MKRILLVDDNEAFRRPLGQVLQQAGYEIESAGDGEAALRAFNERPFDLVITDLIMPGKEGLETIMELGRRRPRPLIIAMSGGAQSHVQDYLPVARRFGAAATLSKPFTAPRLLALVASLLQPGAEVASMTRSPATTRIIAPGFVRPREPVAEPGYCERIR